MSQLSVSRVRTGTFGNRCTSVTPRRSPSNRPTATRPLWAPRSTGGHRRHQPAASSFRTTRRRSRWSERRGLARGPGSAVTTRHRGRATPRPRRRGARVGDDARKLLDGTNESSALRCHFVPSKMPNTCSQASAISCLIRTSSGLRSIRPRSRLSPRAPRNPLLIRVVRSTSRRDRRRATSPTAAASRR